MLYYSATSQFILTSFKKKFVYVCIWMFHLRVCVWCQWRSKEDIEPSGPVDRDWVSHNMWGLRTGHWSSVRALSAVNHWAFSPLPLGGRVSLCNHDWPRNCNVDQSGLKLTKVCLYLQCAGNKSMRHQSVQFPLFEGNIFGFIGFQTIYIKYRTSYKNNKMQSEIKYM